MTRHHCPSDPCPRCADRIDAHEAGPLASDVEAATRQAEGEFEAYATGDDYRDWFGERTAAAGISTDDEADVIRQLRADARRILGRTA